MKTILLLILQKTKFEMYGSYCQNKMQAEDVIERMGNNPFLVVSCSFIFISHLIEVFVLVFIFSCQMLRL